MLAIAIGVALGAAILAGCVLPGRLYPVAPVIRGQIVDLDPALGTPELELVVLHRESMNLHAKQRVAADPAGRFEFPETRLAVAGQEYSKYYRFYLHLEDASGNRVIWRAQRSRHSRSGAIELACDLDRPIRRGQICRVERPLEHDWLIAEGKRTYRRLCARCHGPKGRPEHGGSPEDGSLPADLTTIAARWGGSFDRQAVAIRIVGDMIVEEHRGSDMPIWGERLSTRFERYAEGDELVGATLDPLVAYLESIQRRPTP